MNVPGRADISTTRSARNTASRTLCVTNTNCCGSRARPSGARAGGLARLGVERRRAVGERTRLAGEGAGEPRADASPATARAAGPSRSAPDAPSQPIARSVRSPFGVLTSSTRTRRSPGRSATGTARLLEQHRPIRPAADGLHHQDSPSSGPPSPAMRFRVDFPQPDGPTGRRTRLSRYQRRRRAPARAHRSPGRRSRDGAHRQLRGTEEVSEPRSAGFDVIDSSDTPTGGRFIAEDPVQRVKPVASPTIRGPPRARRPVGVVRHLVGRRGDRPHANASLLHDSSMTGLTIAGAPAQTRRGRDRLRTQRRGARELIAATFAATRRSTTSGGRPCRQWTPTGSP
jgi:hypothetical protein